MFQEVMLLEQREKPFNDPNFIYEPKIDGHRLQLNFTDGKTTLFTRHNNDCTRQYPELHHIEVDGDVVLDGEVCCINPETGAIDFELVMSRFQIKDPAKVATAMKKLPVSYVVFDILFYNGQDLRGLPLMKRKKILHNVLPDTLQIHKIPFIEKDGISLFNEIKKLDMEGIVAKRKDSLYIGKRSSDWIKVSNYQYTDVYLTGYRKGEFGWLASVMEMDGKLRPV
ncbi:ATP-dependent DNA ligase [Brevibacillus gelatini]|uniref:ATP-dependent DNA ligase n=1 Tax=Brevibacillus gelatini TaxID=1655277 RepID=UPI0026CD69CE